MNRSLQRNEEIIRKLQMDKQSYASEITNVRDLNSTVEAKKEQIIRQLTAREIENEQLQAALSDMKIEIDMLRTQINNEKAMVHNLEDIIGSSREKEFQSQIQAQEKDSELQLTKDRANMNDMKLYEDDTFQLRKYFFSFSRQSQGKEIAALRAQIIGLETDNDRLKRQLTSERFERLVHLINSIKIFKFYFLEKKPHRI
jgi:centrosomal protein CEP135